MKKFVCERFYISRGKIGLLLNMCISFCTITYISYWLHYIFQATEKSERLSFSLEQLTLDNRTLETQVSSGLSLDICGMMFILWIHTAVTEVNTVVLQVLFYPLFLLSSLSPVLAVS